MLGFCNYHYFLCVDVPGLGDCQFFSITTNHFSQDVSNDVSTHEKLTKLKRSFINLNERDNNEFKIHDKSKHDEWRKHKVGESLPKRIWMNDEDMRVCSYIFF